MDFGAQKLSNIWLGRESGMSDMSALKQRGALELAAVMHLRLEVVKYSISVNLTQRKGGILDLPPVSNSAFFCVPLPNSKTRQEIKVTFTPGFVLLSRVDGDVYAK